MIYFVRIYPDKAGPLKGLEENHLNEYVINSQFLALHSRTECVFENGGYLIAGQIEISEPHEQSIILDEFSYIPAS